MQLLSTQVYGRSLGRTSRLYCAFAQRERGRGSGVCCHHFPHRHVGTAHRTSATSATPSPHPYRGVVLAPKPKPASRSAACALGAKRPSLVPSGLCRPRRGTRTLQSQVGHAALSHRRASARSRSANARIAASGLKSRTTQRRARGTHGSELVLELECGHLSLQLSSNLFGVRSARAKRGGRARTQHLAVSSGVARRFGAIDALAAAEARTRRSTGAAASTTGTCSTCSTRTSATAAAATTIVPAATAIAAAAFPAARRDAVLATAAAAAAATIARTVRRAAPAATAAAAAATAAAAAASNATPASSADAEQLEFVGVEIAPILEAANGTQPAHLLTGGASRGARLP